MLTPTFVLELALDPDSGQLLRLHDPETGVTILDCLPGAELALNGAPLTTRLVTIEQARHEHITVLEARRTSGYGCGATLMIRRVLSLGGRGLHSGPSHSVHLRYEIQRVGHQGSGDPLDYIWAPEIEAPLMVESLTVLHARQRFQGPGTHLRALALGGTGPREHVSLEDGPVADVSAWLGSWFRSTFPGQPTIAGGLFWHPDDERFVWLMARRSATSGRLEPSADRHAFTFSYFTQLDLQGELITPAISFAWGRGLAEADRVLARQFDLYEEPPAWWMNTSWFWLHPGWQSDGNFDASLAGAQKLMDAGVNGFGLFAHDVPWAGLDCDVGSPMPMPGHGGDEGLRRLAQGIKERGGHSYIWISRNGHRPDSIDYRDSWGVRGVDGRPIRIRNRPDQGVRLDVVNPADPTFKEMLFRWIAYYVRDLGIDGLFWDSGFQPIPPDFGKPYLRHPGEANARIPQFFEEVYRFGRSLSKDFFMWGEGISVDCRMNAFSVDSRRHGANSAHPLMHRLANAGPRRLVWRSAWAHDLASGFPFINPVNDIGWPTAGARYAEAAADPVNRWVCKIVRERGVRHAIGLGDGISRLDEFVVVSPGCAAPITLNTAACPSDCLIHALDGPQVRGVPGVNGVTFVLPTAGPYRFG